MELQLEVSLFQALVYLRIYDRFEKQSQLDIIKAKVSWLVPFIGQTARNIPMICTGVVHGSVEMDKTTFYAGETARLC